jgi:DNA (cytosine-5)-methyltransferase 1
VRYLSVCSGLEAATVAWKPLGWKAAAFSEIEAFPRAVLKHHYPDTPLHGDFTTIEGEEYGPTDILVGGTPCQSFSVAGLRKGLADERGNLALEYLRLADRLSARWLVWENVPGVLSSSGGRDFAAFLGGLAQLGYGFAYRVLDAQFFGVPQRRRRVFVVGYLGDWRRASAVLFERHSLSGDSPPRREKGQGLAKCLTRGASQRLDSERDTFVGGWDYENNAHGPDEPTGPLLKGSPTGGGRPLPEIAFGWQNSPSQGASASEHITPTLDKSKTPAVAFQQSQSGFREHDTHATLDANMGSRRHNGVMQGSAVRRLTPRECERLQGFPDDYTLVPYRNKPAADGPRYKALGNSMAVPVMHWIGVRIASVESLSERMAA